MQSINICKIPKILHPKIKYFTTQNTSIKLPTNLLILLLKPRSDYNSVQQTFHGHGHARNSVRVQSSKWHHEHYLADNAFSAIPAVIASSYYGQRWACRWILVLFRRPFSPLFENSRQPRFLRCAAARITQYTLFLSTTQ